MSPKADNIYIVGQDRYKWYQSHALAKSVSVRGVDCRDPKGMSCNPWDPTLPREAHMDMLIRSDLSLMCRGLFSHYCVHWGRTKP